MRLGLNGVGDSASVVTRPTSSNATRLAQTVGVWGSSLVHGGCGGEVPTCNFLPRNCETPGDAEDHNWSYGGSLSQNYVFVDQSDCIRLGSSVFGPAVSTEWPSVSGVSLFAARTRRESSIHHLGGENLHPVGLEPCRFGPLEPGQNSRQKRNKSWTGGNRTNQRMTSHPLRPISWSRLIEGLTIMIKATTSSKVSATIDTKAVCSKCGSAAI